MSTPQQIRALPLSSHVVSRLIRRDAFAALVWPVPLMFGLAAMVLGAGTTWLDERLRLQPGSLRLIVGDVETAVSLTSVVATGMLGFLAIVFSTTLVAIQLAGSQYSPRAVRVFVRSTTTKVTLGVFIGTFLFAVATLIDVRSTSGTGDPFIPVISMTILSALLLATIAMFLAFVHTTSRLLRVQYLVERIAEDSLTSISTAFLPADSYLPVPAPDEEGPAHEITAGDRHGVLEAVDVVSVGRMAAGCGGWIEFLVPVGTYVPVGTPVAVVHGPRPVDPGEFVRALRMGGERTMVQDPGFGIRQLVDIAIRALSPAVNDPTTAAQVLDRLTGMLTRLAERPDPTGWYADGGGVVRVRLAVDGFDGLLRLAFTEIIRYGADSPQVVRRMLATFDRIDRSADERRRAAVEVMRGRLRQMADEAIPTALAGASLEADARGLG